MCACVRVCMYACYSVCTLYSMYRHVQRCLGAMSVVSCKLGTLTSCSHVGHRGKSLGTTLEAAQLLSI